MTRSRKTEHNGAKNGGGYWGVRSEAKQTSKKVRRRNDRALVKNNTNCLTTKLKKA